MEQKSGSGAGSLSISSSASGQKHAAGSATVKGTFDLPDDHALELGRFFVKMSVIEGSLEGLIWLAAGMSPQTGCLFTRRMDLTYKIERLDELLELRKADTSIINKWTKAKSLLGEPRKHRNSFAHAMPIRFGASPILMTTKDAKIGNVYKAIPTQIDETKKHINAADEALKLIQGITDVIETPTSPGKS